MTRKQIHCGCQAQTGSQWLMWALQVVAANRERRYEDLVDSGHDPGWPRQQWKRAMAAHDELHRMFDAAGR